MIVSFSSVAKIQDSTYTDKTRALSISCTLALVKGEKIGRNFRGYVGIFPIVFLLWRKGAVENKLDKMDCIRSSRGC